MAEETPTNGTGPIDSKIGSVSVRSLLALMIVSVVCGAYIGAVIIDLIASYQKQVAPTFAIPEPIYGGFMLILGAYIGKTMSSQK